MKESNPIWDYEDDYYFTFVGYIEINIRAYSENNLHLWMYEHGGDKEIADDDFSSLALLQLRINEILGAEVTLPKIEDLLKLGEKNV
ncbi:hypothetical protein [Candidatus Sulfurimonas baltica]|uniref:Uncharacterized protein n=1 Tax=Candidatus Sulfurimonas baltica TaxID=2740404 RepID=A0A7S7LSV6_9BACT|nr:hypothetical protein [Candidatus Sulfurimonas baltica]QOY50919.1 hypothetical protein HUE88_07120 [Candidatus Sulfurimonas baltica]